MRTLGILFVASVVLVAAGFYFQWFTLSTNSSTDHPQIEVTVDKEKIQQDINKLKQEARQLGQSISKKTDSLPQ